MKLKHLILFLAVVLAACSTRHPVETRFIASPNKQLQAIDSLLWQHPDSALMVLVDFAGSPQADSLGTFDGHYFQMLLSELLYKNDCEQTNREELLKAVDYFDSIVTTDDRDAMNRVSTDNLVFLDARVHYINGVGFYERDCVVEACAEYLKALKVMESHFKEKDLLKNKAKFMAYTYNRLGDMFEEQLSAELAITCYKQALFYCHREPTSIYGIPVLLYNLGMQYDVSGQIDSAYFYYNEALANLPDYDNIHYRDIMSTKALLDHYDFGLCSDSIIKDLKYIISLSADENEKTASTL